MKRRVAITGLGVKCSVGNKVDEFWKNIVDGKHGIKLIDTFDTSSLNVKVAAINSEFKPEEYLDKKEIRRTDRFCQFAIAAAQDALDDAGNLKENYDPFRVGVIVSSGIGGFETIEKEYISSEKAAYTDFGGNKLDVLSKNNRKYATKDGMEFISAVKKYEEEVLLKR